MTFAQAGALFHAAGIKQLSDVPTLATLERLQANILGGDIGAHNIRSDWFKSPLGPEQIQLPRAFTILGQKFILDSWALNQVVFDNILWDTNGVPSNDDKVPRRVPSGLDVAFGVFGNNQIVPDLIARIENQNADWNIFRDGMFYQHNLAAVRAVVERHPASAWNQNLYMGWLATLRELSAPVTETNFPDALRTRAWAMKDLNTQLSSWTQLRHDTVLYAEQSQTGGGGICSYPKGFVEPRPPFWRRLVEMAQTAAKLIETTDYSGTIRLEYPAGSGVVIETNLSTIQTRQAAFFRRFADVDTTLLDMSERELRQAPFTREQEDFFQNTMYAQLYEGYDAQFWNVYDGWYPKLFYRPLSKEPSPHTPEAEVAQVEGAFQFIWGSLRWDALVTDVHTDLPCLDCIPDADPGSVLHEGIGRAHLLMVAINNGNDRCVYAGPVLSHYEFELKGAPQRLSDPEWRQRWGNAGFNAWSSPQDSIKGVGRDWSGLPPQPDWTRSYLVPLR